MSRKTLPRPSGAPEPDIESDTTDSQTTAEREHGTRPAADQRAGRAAAPGTEAADTDHSDFTPAPVVLAKRATWVRVVAVLAVLFTAWHIFASLVWIAPASSEGRKLVPREILNGYMLPLFGQSWSVFAPEPINGDHHFKVRAIIDENGTEKTTEWVDAVAVEAQMLTHQLFPARAGNQAINLASDFRSQYNKLNEEQKRIVGLNYFKDDWYEREGAELAAANNGTAPGGFLAVEQKATRYATQVATTVWGDDVVRVQYQVERQNVIPFAQRNNPDAKRPDVQLTPSGWRALDVAEHQDHEAFADVFGRLYEQYEEQH